MQIKQYLGSLSFVHYAALMESIIGTLKQERNIEKGSSKTEDELK